MLPLVSSQMEHAKLTLLLCSPRSSAHEGDDCTHMTTYALKVYVHVLSDCMHK